MTPLIAAMTPDGSNVVFGFSGIGLPSKPQLLLWKAQSHAAVTIVPEYPAYGVAISADGLRAAVVTGSGTYAVDLAAQTSTLLSACVPAAHMQPQFSRDGRFLAYLVKANSTLNQINLYDFSVPPTILPAALMGLAIPLPSTPPVVSWLIGARPPIWRRAT